MTTKHEALLRWRFLTSWWPAGDLAESLSVEGLPYDEIPGEWYSAVRAFRKLRHDERERICRAFLGRLSR